MKNRSRSLSFVNLKNECGQNYPFVVRENLEHIERNRSGFFCNVCKTVFQLSSSDEISVNSLIAHFNGKRHKWESIIVGDTNLNPPVENSKKREILFLEDDSSLVFDSGSAQLDSLIEENERYITCGLHSWFCLLCKVKIPYSCQKDKVNNLALHLNTKRHQIKVESKIELPSQSRNFSSKTSQCEVDFTRLCVQGMLTKLCNSSFIMQLNEKYFTVSGGNEFFCKACKEIIPYSKDSFQLQEHCKSRNHYRTLDSLSYRFILSLKIDRRILIVHKKDFFEEISKNLPLGSKDCVAPTIKFIANIDRNLFCLICNMTLKYSQKGGSIKKHLTCNSHKDLSYELLSNQQKKRRHCKSSYVAVLPSPIAKGDTHSFTKDEGQTKPKRKNQDSKMVPSKRVFDIVKQNGNVVMKSSMIKTDDTQIQNTDVIENLNVCQVRLLSYKPLENEFNEEIHVQNTTTAPPTKQRNALIHPCKTRSKHSVLIPSKPVDSNFGIPNLDEKRLQELFDASLEGKLNGKYFTLKETQLYCVPCKRFVRCNKFGPRLIQHCKSATHNLELSKIADDFLSKLSGNGKVSLNSKDLPEGALDIIRMMGKKYPGTRSTHHLRFIRYDGEQFFCLLCDVQIPTSRKGRFVKVHFLSEKHQKLSYQLLSENCESVLTKNSLREPFRDQTDRDLSTSSRKQPGNLMTEKDNVNQIETDVDLLNNTTRTDLCLTSNSNFCAPETLHLKKTLNGDQPQEVTICADSKASTSNVKVSGLETILKRLLKRSAGTLLHSEYFCIKDGKFFCQVCLEEFEFTQFSTYLDLHCESTMHNKALEKLATDFVFSCSRTYKVFLSEEDDEKFRFAVCALQGKYPICNFKYKLMYIGFQSGSFICSLCQEPIAYTESGKSVYQHLIAASHQQKTLALLLKRVPNAEKNVFSRQENLPGKKVIRKMCLPHSVVKASSQNGGTTILKDQTLVTSTLSTMKDLNHVISSPREDICKANQSSIYKTQECSPIQRVEEPHRILLPNENVYNNNVTDTESLINNPGISEEVSVETCAEVMSQIHKESPQERHKIKVLMKDKEQVKESFISSDVDKQDSTEDQTTTLLKYAEDESGKITVNLEMNLPPNTASMFKTDVEKRTEFQKDSLVIPDENKSNQIQEITNQKCVPEAKNLIRAQICESSDNQELSDLYERGKIDELYSASNTLKNLPLNDKMHTSTTQDGLRNSIHVEGKSKENEYIKFNVESNVSVINYILTGVCGKLKIVRDFFELRGESLFCTLCNCCLPPIKSLLYVEEIIQSHVFKSGHLGRDSAYQCIRNTPLPSLINSKLSMIFNENKLFIERRGPFYFHCKLCNLVFPNSNDDMFSNINLALHFETFKHTNVKMILVAPQFMPLSTVQASSLGNNQNVGLKTPVLGAPLVKTTSEPRPKIEVPAVGAQVEVKVKPEQYVNHQTLENRQSVEFLHTPEKAHTDQSIVKDLYSAVASKKISKPGNKDSSKDSRLFDNASVCQQCKEVFEVYNNDLEFSLQVHTQKHKTLSEINENYELACETDVAYICKICQRPIEILNQDQQLSRSRHFEMYHSSDNTNLISDQENYLDFEIQLESLGEHKQFIVLEGPCASCILCNWRTSLSCDQTLALQPLRQHIQDPYHLNQYEVFLEESMRFTNEQAIKFKKIEAKIEHLDSLLESEDSTMNISTNKKKQIKSKSGSSVSRPKPDDSNSKKLKRLLENVTDEIVKQNERYIQLKGEELFCALCSVPCGFSLKSRAHPDRLQIHFSGKLHKEYTKLKSCE